jgi:hypothetical protein
VREIEVKRNNEILGDKIINIFAIKNKKKFKPLFDIKKKKQTSINKYFTSRVEQDNQQMLKRLVDLPSNYNKKLWNKDFEKSQEYKKNICVFPSIKFFKNNEKENEFERNLHSSHHKNINMNTNINSNDPNNNINNINNQASYFYMNNSNAIGFLNSNEKKRSNTSYAKFKNTEKLYNSKYFQNLHTEDSSK